MTKNEVAKFYKENLNWNQFFSLVDTVGPLLNSPKDRFEKSDLFEKSLQTFSKEKIKYINQEGADHKIPELNIFSEFKFDSKSLYNINKKGKFLKKQVGSIRLVNTNRKEKATSLPLSYSPYVVLADTQGAMVIDTETLKQYLHYGEGNIEAKKIPMSLFAKIVGPEDITYRKKLENFNYKQAKEQFQIDFLNKFI